MRSTSKSAGEYQKTQSTQPLSTFDPTFTTGDLKTIIVNSIALWRTTTRTRVDWPELRIERKLPISSLQAALCFKAAVEGNNGILLPTVQSREIWIKLAKGRVLYVGRNMGTELPQKLGGPPHSQP